MKLRSVILLLAFAAGTVWGQSAAVKREFRGAWVASVLNLDWPSASARGATPTVQKNELIAMLDVLANSGCNAVVLQIRPECDALYASPYEPWSYWLTGVQGQAPSPFYDPLQFAVEETHKRGMELHAWFNPYRAERTVGNYTTASSHVTKSHPEWILQVGNYKFLDPGLPEVRNYVSMVFSDVVRRYDIDAAHIDDYFYQSGVNKEDDSSFAHYPRGFSSKGDWRRDNVNIVIKQIYDSIRAVKPWVKWGVSPAGIYKNGVPSGTSGQDNYSVIYCDAVAWMQAQSLDYIAPQLYWAFGGGQDYALLQPWWGSQRNGRHMYVGLGVYNLAAAEIVKQVRYNRATPANNEGQIYYQATNIKVNRGGILDLMLADIHRYPAMLPNMIWKEQTPPNAPSGLASAYNSSTGKWSLNWAKPLPATDGDTAARFAVYRFATSSPTAADYQRPENLIAITGTPTAVPSARLDTIGVTYYFAVTSLDRNANESGASNVVTLGAGPAAVTLSTPDDGTLTFRQTDRLVWKKTAGAESYAVQVSKTADFAAASIVAFFNLADSSVALSGLLPQTTYYWRVWAGTQTGASPASPVRSFTTAWPMTPTALLPTGLNQSRVPTFKWTRGGATSFQIEVRQNDMTTGPVIIDTVVTDTVWTMNRVLAASTIHRWHVKGTNAYGTTDWSAVVAFKTDNSTVAVERDLTQPAEFVLDQNYPNPFNPTTTIRYSLPANAHVVLNVYNMLGERMAELVNGMQQAGYHTMEFNAANLPSGVYFLRLQAGGAVAVRKLILLR